MECIDTFNAKIKYFNENIIKNIIIRIYQTFLEFVQNSCPSAIYVMNSKKHYFKFYERGSVTLVKRQSRNSVGRYVDWTSLLSGFTKVLDRIPRTLVVDLRLL